MQKNEKGRLMAKQLPHFEKGLEWEKKQRKKGEEWEVQLRAAIESMKIPDFETYAHAIEATHGALTIGEEKRFNLPRS